MHLEVDLFEYLLDLIKVIEVEVIFVENRL